jgi:hypothetical protein
VVPIASIVVMAALPTLSTGVTQERVAIPVQVDRAGAAEGQAAAELGAGHTQHIAQDPQQRGIAVDVDAMLSTVNLDYVGHDNLLLFCYELDERAQFVIHQSSVGILRLGEWRDFDGRSSSSRSSICVFVSHVAFHEVGQRREFEQLRRRKSENDDPFGSK